MLKLYNKNSLKVTLRITVNRLSLLLCFIKDFSLWPFLQLIRLLENLECTMIYDVIRRISREHTLVVSERGRDDATLPTDLWKRPVS